MSLDLPNTIGAVSALCAVVSTGCALFAVWQAGRWKESDAMKALDKRISDCERDVDLVERDIHTIKERVADLPTKADLAAVGEKVVGVMREIGSVNACVQRLEGFMIERGLDRN